MASRSAFLSSGRPAVRTGSSALAASKSAVSEVVGVERGAFGQASAVRTCDIEISSDVVGMGVGRPEGGSLPRDLSNRPGRAGLVLSVVLLEELTLRYGRRRGASR